MSRFQVGALVALFGIVGGCMGAQPPTATLSLDPTPTQAATATKAQGTPTAASSTDAASPTAIAATPTAADTDPCATSTQDDPAEPPAAALTGTSATSVDGRLGSYTYCDLAVDALPPRAESLAAVPLGNELTLATSGAEGFVAYRAGYWPAAEWQGDEIRYAADKLATPAEQVAFASPPNGDWMLVINLTFPSGGDAAYYWHVTVP